MAIPSIYKTVTFEEDRSRKRKSVESKHLDQMVVTMNNFITHFKHQHL